MASPRQDGPRVAVVVTTHNRASLLPRLLSALAAQQLSQPFEVVVVDDASSDETPAELSRLARASSVPVQALTQAQNAGPAAARNRGWRATAAEFVAFTDDDCEPQPGWLDALVAALAGSDLAQGRTRPAPDQLHASGPFSRTLHVEQADGFWQTCNIGYRREWLERLGGFDEEFRHPAGEDTELAWRAIEAGAQATFVPEALVYHDVRPSNLRVAIKDTRRWGAVVLAVRKHPPLRSRLHNRWFWRAAHPPALLAVAGVAVAASRPTSPVRLAAAAAAAAPYVRFRLRVQPLPGTSSRRRVALLPAALLLDATEVAVCAVASVRYRRLVL